MYGWPYPHWAAATAAPLPSPRLHAFGVPVPAAAADDEREMARVSASTRLAADHAAAVPYLSGGGGGSGGAAPAAATTPVAATPQILHSGAVTPPRKFRGVSWSGKGASGGSWHARIRENYQNKSVRR